MTINEAAKFLESLETALRLAREAIEGAEIQAKKSYEERLTERVEAFEKEKAMRPEPEAKKKAPPVEDLRLKIHELAEAMKEKYGLTSGRIFSNYARIVGRPVGKITDLKKSEGAAVFEMLESWDADLQSAAQEKIKCDMNTL